MSKGIIPGIHNYCDRWCERCAFTSRCAVYEPEDAAPIGDVDMRNKLFWEKLAKNFAKAKELLEQAAEKHGIDMNQVREDMKRSEELEEEREQARKNHVLTKLSAEYGSQARQWLKTQPGMLDKLNFLKEELTLGTQSQESAREQTLVIKDSLAVIEWYSTFLQAKLMRAVSGKLDDFWDDEDEQRDYDGSAKVAIIGIERSMQAWLNLFEILPEREDDFLTLLASLEKMKSTTLSEFPNAMKFIRPGFDENL